jgi:hypothetical protein
MWLVEGRRGMLQREVEMSINMSRVTATHKSELIAPFEG